MNLLIDIGNTRIKYVYENAGELSDVNTICVEKLTREFLLKYWSIVDKIILASVAQNSIVEKINNFAIQHGIFYQRILSECRKNNVISAYQECHKLGVDRWLTLLACAKHYNNKPVVIIDTGTATTIDLLGANGIHYGGWIIPGIDTMTSSLVSNTRNINELTNTVPSTDFATNTNDNVVNGCLAASLGAIYYAVEKAKQRVSFPSVVITGGNASQLVENLTFPIIFDKKLIFKGLQLYI